MTDLKACDIEQICLEETNFKKAKLEGADLIRAQLKWVKLTQELLF